MRYYLLGFLIGLVLVILILVGIRLAFASTSTIVGIAPVQWMHSRCAMRYDADRVWRLDPHDCVFVATFEH